MDALSSGCFFCHECGSKLKKLFCYCPKCGATVPRVGSGSVNKDSWDDLNPLPRLKSFNSFKARRESERQSFFSGRKSKRVKTDKKEFTIYVGIMEDKDTIVRGETRREGTSLCYRSRHTACGHEEFKRHKDWNKKFGETWQQKWIPPRTQR